ncbi:hypothetical protein ACFL5O_08980, partial [Myxococcota bacterium]
LLPTSAKNELLRDYVGYDLTPAAVCSDCYSKRAWLESLWDSCWPKIAGPGQGATTTSGPVAEQSWTTGVRWVVRQTAPFGCSGCRASVFATLFAGITWMSIQAAFTMFPT